MVALAQLLAFSALLMPGFIQVCHAMGPRWETSKSPQRPDESAQMKKPT